VRTQADQHKKSTTVVAVDFRLPLRVRTNDAGAIVLTTFATAFSTPLPPYRLLSPSRSSTASFSPVEAPEGTEETANVPPSSTTMNAHRRDFREPRISCAFTFAILAWSLSADFARGLSRGRDS
jgi:hypothetical protein